MARWKLIWAALLAGWLLMPAQAEAYPWMVQHQYTTCSQCHVDPSGGSALTAYGRAQTEVLLRSRYTDEPVGEPGPVKDFLFGAVPLPDEVIAQADVRGLFIPRPDQFRAILMQADLRGGVQTKTVTAYASAGVVSEGARGARILSEEGRTNEVLTPVMRDYWVGVTPVRGLMVRAGRMNLPFGIRSDEHILFVRSVTRTTTNADQQLGVAASYEGRKWRGEAMAVLGNYQVAPDAFRERGYSAFWTYTPSNRVELGVSSLVLGAQAGLETGEPTTRQAHGVFTRVSPVSRLALLAELNGLATTSRTDGALAGTAVRSTAPGVVGNLQADWEAVRGVHLKAGGEVCAPDTRAEAGTVGRGWGGVQWFFAPHVNLRVDALYGPINCTPGSDVRPMAFAQLHAFL